MNECPTPTLQGQAKGPPFPACAFSPFVWRAAGPAALIVGALLPFALLTLYGKIQLVDPQTGKINYHYYFDYQGKISVQFCRIDKAGINLDRLNEICEWSGL